MSIKILLQIQTSTLEYDIKATNWKDEHWYMVESH